MLTNRPLPIGFDKTISQPFMVAGMTDLQSRATCDPLDLIERKN